MSYQDFKIIRLSLTYVIHSRKEHTTIIMIMKILKL